MKMYCKFTDPEPMMKNKTELGGTELGFAFFAIFLPLYLPLAINICIISVMYSTLWHLNTEVTQLSVKKL